jgi:hypothetical protein
MLEEELQHRGQRNALFWQMDIDPRADARFGSELKKTLRPLMGLQRIRRPSVEADSSRCFE